MKAVLVIDVPDKYRTEDVLVDYCLHTKGEYKTIRKSGNHPLKPLPKTKSMTKADHTYDPWEDTYRRGWNDCLEEIEE